MYKRKMWSNGSKSLTELVVLSFLVIVVGGTVPHFSCDQTNTRPAGSSSYCSSEDAVLCQAVLDASLSVECWTCPNGTTVSWTMTNSSGQQVELNTTDQTLNLSASEVNMQAAGCYQCKCEEAGVPSGVNFSVMVEQEGKPKFSVRTGSHTGNVYELSPYERDVTLNASVSGVTVVNCSATGYPDPTYTWQVSVNGEVINDSCIRITEGGKLLNFIPTPWNTRDILHYKFTCTVQNAVPGSTIVGEQMINFDNVKGWLLHPCSIQSGNVVYLHDGNATGVVAACDYSAYGIKYLICANMTAVTPADNPACSVDLYMSEEKCCNCTKPNCSCHMDLDLRMGETTVTDSEGLGLSIEASNFTTSKEQHLLFFARRTLPHYSSAKVYQLIGFTTVEKEPTSPSSSSFSEGTFIGSIVGSGSGAALLSTATLICVILVGVGIRKICFPRPNARRYQVVPPHNSAAPAAGVAVQQGAGDAECSWWYIGETSTEDRVRCIHQAFVDGVNIDPGVLAAMYAKNVVNRHQNGQIHARHERHEPRDVIAAYFANSVLSNWPDDIFEQQMKNLVKVLEESDDEANRTMAERLSDVMSFETSADLFQSCKVQESGNSLQ